MKCFKCIRIQNCGYHFITLPIVQDEVSVLIPAVPVPEALSELPRGQPGARGPCSLPSHRRRFFTGRMEPLRSRRFPWPIGSSSEHHFSMERVKRSNGAWSGHKWKVPVRAATYFQIKACICRDAVRQAPCCRKSSTYGSFVCSLFLGFFTAQKYICPFQ